MPVVRVSVYLPWRPADVYCDGAEYSSNQYGPHQYWISHSGLARCPPAAYSNIVSRIVIIGAELWPSSLQATEYFQRNPKKMSLLPFPYKSVWFQRMWDLDHWGSGEIVEGFGEHPQPQNRQGGKGMERWWKSKNPTRPKTGMKACLDLWYMVFFFFFSSLPFFHPHTYTWESRQLMCCLWWQREAYINGQKDHDERAEEKEAKWVENVLLERMATHDEYLGWSDGNQTSGSWGFDDLTAAEERLR